MRISSLIICLTSISSCAFVAATPVPQEGKSSISTHSNINNHESNSRRAYLSKQFEDHTKNFILKAQERFELQAEKRKQHAKTKKAYSTVNKLPASSPSGTTNTVEGTNSLLKLPNWLLKRNSHSSLSSSSSSSSMKQLHRFKRQGESGLNLDSLLDFVKEQTAKLDQVNNQLKSLANSVSQGLDKLRKAANESFIDLKESASQVSHEVRTALDTFNSGPKQGESISDLTLRALRSLTGSNGDTMSPSSDGSQYAYEAMESLRKSVTNAYEQFKSSWSNLAENVS